MDPRVSTIESDVASVRAQVETIHSNYATNIALLEAEARLHMEIVSVKNELNVQLINLDRKIDQVALQQTLEFQRIAGDMRNWLLGTVIGLVIGFGGLVLGIARMTQA